MKKSTITCDMEGRILTMNDGAEQVFGYPKEELIGKKRVSIFSPGEIVLQNVEGWLDEAVKKGEYIGKTYFIKKNKEKFNAKIRITPTFANGKDKAQTGYCGVTEVIEENVDVDVFTYKVRKNDIFVLCSDGLHSKVSDSDILHIINKFIPDPKLADEKTLHQTVASLVAQANANGGNDNISVILVVAQ